MAPWTGHQPISAHTPTTYSYTHINLVSRQHNWAFKCGRKLQKNPHGYTFWGSSPLSVIILSSNIQEWSQHPRAGCICVIGLFMHVWLLLSWLFMHCQQSYPLVRFQPAQKASFSHWCENVFLTSLEPTCLISPRKANRSALAVLQLIGRLKTYSLFWWSEEWTADVSLKVTYGLSLSSIYKRTRAALKSICWMLRGWEMLFYSILYHSS